LRFSPASSQSPNAELADVPQLSGRWVALAPAGRSPHPANSARPAAPGANPNRLRFPLQLRSGAVVVDADRELDVLCARLRAAEETSLTIVFAR
jgi:hypothetical protein